MQVLEDRVQDAKFRIQGSGYWVPGTGFRIQGSAYGVPNTGFKIKGSGYRV